MPKRFRRLMLCLLLAITGLFAFREPTRRTVTKVRAPAMRVRPAVDWRVFDRAHPRVRGAVLRAI